MEFDKDDESTFISCTKHKKFFGMELFSYRVMHTCLINNEKHINTILVDQTGLFRGYVDAYTENIELKKEIEDTSEDFSSKYINYSKLSDNIPNIENNPLINLFLFFDTNNMWLLEIVKKDLELKSVELIKLITDKLLDIKKIYTKEPKSTKISIADLDLHLWNSEGKIIAISFKNNNNFDIIDKTILEMLNYYTDAVLIPRKKAFLLLPSIFSNPKFNEHDIKKVLRLLTDNLLFTRIKVKYPDRISTIEKKLLNYFSSVKKLQISNVFKGEISLINILEKNKDDINLLWEIFDIIDFINRRNLLI